MTGKDTSERGGGYPGVINVQQGGVPGCYAVFIRVMGNVRSDGEYGGGYTHRFPVTYHGESGTVKLRQNVGDTGVM